MSSRHQPSWYFLAERSPCLWILHPCGVLYYQHCHYLLLLFILLPYVTWTAYNNNNYLFSVKSVWGLIVQNTWDHALTFIIPSSIHPIKIGTIAILRPGFLSLNSNSCCWYLWSFPLYLSWMFFSFRHAVSIIVIFLSYVAQAQDQVFLPCLSSLNWLWSFNSLFSLLVNYFSWFPLFVMINVL